MARTNRIVQPGAPHHVILRGNNRRRLFSNESEYSFFLSLIERAARLTCCLVHVLCLMGNHVHLIITPPSAAALSEMIKRVTQRYAQVRNKRRDSSGKLFEERFRCEPIMSERQLAIATAYVDLNPVRAGIVPLTKPYRWSTHALQTGQGTAAVPRRLWTPSFWYLALGRDPASRCSAYVAWLAEFESHQAEDDWAPPLRDPPQAAGRKRFERPNRSLAT